MPARAGGLSWLLLLPCAVATVTYPASVSKGDIITDMTAINHAQLEITWPCTNDVFSKHIYVGQNLKVCWSHKGYTSAAQVKISLTRKNYDGAGSIEPLDILHTVSGISAGSSQWDGSVGTGTSCHTFTAPANLPTWPTEEAFVWMHVTITETGKLTTIETLRQRWKVKAGAPPAAPSGVTCEAGSASAIQMGVTSTSPRDCQIVVSKKTDGTCCSSWEYTAGCKEHISTLGNIMGKTGTLLTHTVDAAAFEAEGIQSVNYYASTMCKGSTGLDTAWVYATQIDGTGCANSVACPTANDLRNWNTRTISTDLTEGAFCNGAILNRHSHLACGNEYATGACKAYGQTCAGTY